MDPLVCAERSQRGPRFEEATACAMRVANAKPHITRHSRVERARNPLLGAEEVADMVEIGAEVMDVVWMGVEDVVKVVGMGAKDVLEDVGADFAEILQSCMV